MSSAQIERISDDRYKEPVKIQPYLIVNTVRYSKVNPAWTDTQAQTCLENQTRLHLSALVIGFHQVCAMTQMQNGIVGNPGWPLFCCRPAVGSGLFAKTIARGLQQLQRQHHANKRIPFRWHFQFPYQVRYVFNVLSANALMFPK